MAAHRGPTLIVAAAIVRSNKVLLARRIQPELPEAHLKWELPGGKVELEESPHEAIMREIKEELDTEIRVVRLLPHVQSNIYHGHSRLVHSVITAFESVIIRGKSLPKAAEDSVGAVRWIEIKDLDKISLLPGTKEFIECLEKVDRASYGAENIFVRLEKRSQSGLLTDYWEIRSVYDLWNDFNIVERHANLINRSTHNKIAAGIDRKKLFIEITKRIRSLVSSGYYLADSDNIRFCPVICPA